MTNTPHLRAFGAPAEIAASPRVRRMRLQVKMPVSATHEHLAHPGTSSIMFDKDNDPGVVKISDAKA